MGVVFRARDSRLGRDVALKCPWPHLSTDAVGRHRFLREARATSRLAHPTIVPVYEVFEDRELPWIAMELVEGRRTLAEVLISGEPLPLDQILQHAEDLTDALRAAHAKGVLHRDIKPSNVLLGTDGRARLTDFGLARFFAPADRPPEIPADGTSAVTEEGKVVGTIAYMAPEMLLGAPADPRSDLFSLGVILYEMCTGRAAFGPSSHWDAYQAVLRGEPAAIARFNYEIPRSLERLVRKALAKQPDERYQDARDMLADVRSIRHRLASGTVDAEEELDVGRRRRTWVTWTVLGLSALSLGIAAWIAIASRPPALNGIAGRPYQLTSAPGVETEPAVSPDGNLVAYAASAFGDFDIWIVDTRGGNPLRITDDPAEDRSPAWFPDGSSIAFTSSRGGADGIWKVPALGGSATSLVANASDAAIAPDGTRIAYCRADANGQSRIFVAPIGNPDAGRPLTADDVGLWGQYTPAWSPDSGSIAFSDFSQIWVTRVDDGSPRRLTENSIGDSRPFWTSDGESIVFTSYRAGTAALWRVPARGGAAKRLTLGAGPERLATIDRDGHRLVFSTASNDSDIGIRDLVKGTFARLGSRHAIGPAVAPDGRRVVFGTDQWGGKTALAAQALEDGRAVGPVERLTDRPVALLRFSPDGKWLAYWRVIDGARDVWTMSASGGEETRFDDDPAADLQPAWSPGGRELAFVSERGGGSHIWIAPVAEGKRAGPARQVTASRELDMFPEWSPDGRRLAFLRGAEHGSDIWTLELSTGTERRITTHGEVQTLRWLPPPMGLLASGTWGGTAYEVRRVDPATGAATSLSPPILGTSDENTSLFDVDRAGRVMATTEQEERGDIWLVESQRGAF